MKSRYHVLFTRKPLHTLDVGDIVYSPVSQFLRKVLYVYRGGDDPCFILSRATQIRRAAVYMEYDPEGIRQENVLLLREVIKRGFMHVEITPIRRLPRRVRKPRPPAAPKKYCLVCEKILNYKNVSGLCREHYVEKYGSTRPINPDPYGKKKKKYAI